MTDMNATDWKTIKNAVLGALVTAAVGGSYWFIADHFALATLVKAQDQYVRRDVLEIKLESMKKEILETQKDTLYMKKNQILMMEKMRIQPLPEE